MWLRFCVCVHMYLYLYTYMHINIHRNTYTNIHSFYLYLCGFEILFILYTYRYIHSYFYTYTHCTETHMCVYISMHSIYIRHAWKFLGVLGILGVLDIFSWQRSVCLFLFHICPTLLFHPKSRQGESTCSSIPALPQRGENCLDVNVGLKGDVFTEVFKQMCNWWIGLAAFCQYFVRHYSCKLAGSSGSWLFSHYPFPASSLLI